MLLKSAYGSAVSYSALPNFIYSFVCTARFLTNNTYTICVCNVF